MVVGARGSLLLLGTQLGPVAARVAAHAACPVVVVRGGTVATASAQRPVVVGVDGSAAASVALRTAALEAVRAGAPLRIVCAWTPTSPAGWDATYWLAVDRSHDPDDTARMAAERVAEAAAGAARCLAPGLPVETRVRGGDPAAVVVDAARGAGLLVLGAGDRGDPAGTFLGSVGYRVVHGARIPVLVVRPGGAANDPPAAVEAVTHSA